MGYQKILVDNTVCSRRFHVTFDDRDPKLAKVELSCPFCGVVVFSATNHPQPSLARQENLVQTAELSDNLINECRFRDVMSEKNTATQPRA